MYLQTMGSDEQELGFAWARGLKFPANFKLPSFPRINLPQFPSPPRFVPPRMSPPRINMPTLKAPVIKAPVIKAPKVDFNKIQKELARPSQQLAKSVSQGAKSISKGLNQAFSSLSPGSSPGEIQDDQFQDQEQFYEPEQANFNDDLVLTEEPGELTQQESEEMLGALTQGQGSLLNTGLSLATSFIPGASMLQPAMSNMISQATKKPVKKPNALQLLQQLQKRPAPKQAPIKKPLLKATQRSLTPLEEKKSDNTLLIVGGIAVVALLMMKKKR